MNNMVKKNFCEVDLDYWFKDISNVYYSFLFYYLSYYGIIYVNYICINVLYVLYLWNVVM